MRLTVKDGGGAAWRARYLHLMDGDAITHQICHVGIDPNDGTRPTFFGAIGGWWIQGRKHWIPQLSWRIPLPHIPWRWAMRVNYNPAFMQLYKMSSWFWHKMDGRYGWGGSCR